MFLWDEAPVLRLFIPFVAGVLLGIFYPVSPQLILIATAIILAISAAFVFSRYGRQFNIRWISGVFITTICLCIGYSITLLNTHPHRQNWYGHITQNATAAEVRILEPPQEKEKTYAADAEVRRIFSGKKSSQTTGKVKLYFAKDSLAPPPQYGDVILIANNFSAIPPPQNPGEFDYRKYMQFDQVYHRAYLKPPEWQITAQNEANWVWQQVFALRAALTFGIEEHLGAGNEAAVAKALLIGVKDGLNNEIRDSYASTGAMHVLAVSGLHVGIFYLVLNFLLGFLGKIRGGRFLKALIIALLLWTYAFLTGLSPSVMRAVTMFSFISFGANLRRHTSIYNSIFMSAFALLFINPFLLMQVGFQLSYAALLGIVIIQPKLYDLWLPQSWLLDKIWMITCVSIAAQIATFPLGLLYFSQFPVYFFISNLVVIPAASIILYTGIAFLLSWAIGINALALILGEALEWIILALNQIIMFIERIPFSLIRGVFITIPDAIWIYGIIALLLSGFFFRNGRILIACLATVIIFGSKELYVSIQQQQERKMIIHAIPNESGINFISGGKATLLGSPTLTTDAQALRFHMERYLWQHGIASRNWQPVNFFSEVENPYLRYRHPLGQFGNTTFLVARPETEVPSAPDLKVNLLILQNNPRLNIEDLQQKLNFETVVIDASNTIYRAKKWKEECERLNLQCRDLRSQGALVIEM